MLEIEDVYKTFNEGTAHEVRALQGVSVTIDEGSFTVVIGTNGSGKSSLLNAVAGTFQVDRGHVRIAGHDVTRWPEYRRASLLGRVFQNPFSGTAPNLSIAENLALAARRGERRGLGPAISARLRGQMRDVVRELNMGLEDRLDTPIGSLSGGQRQALTLLMAAWQKPRVLLLDEHTAALDPKSAEQVVALSEQVISRDRLTTVMVTHSMQQAARLGDRLLMMHRGKILLDLGGDQKKRVRPEELLAHFEEVRRSELLDESAAEMLARCYV
ncbi:MAG: ATP-binding cassette domain-containing protein [Acidobacteria bacterium]|nr:ATP-binding cassette domain-containing protein [Acidobacteriota bacterium]